VTSRSIALLFNLSRRSSKLCGETSKSRHATQTEATVLKRVRLLHVSWSSKLVRQAPRRVQHCPRQTLQNVFSDHRIHRKSPQRQCKAISQLCLPNAES
jgi:hypothetical protein